MFSVHGGGGQSASSLTRALSSLLCPLPGADRFLRSEAAGAAFSFFPLTGEACALQLLLRKESKAARVASFALRCF